MRRRRNERKGREIMFQQNLKKKNDKQTTSAGLQVDPRE